MFKLITYEDTKSLGKIYKELFEKSEKEEAKKIALSLSFENLLSNLDASLKETLSKNPYSAGSTGYENYTKGAHEIMHELLVKGIIQFHKNYL